MKKKNLVRLVTWPRIKVDGTIGRCSSLSRIPGIPKSSARVFEKTRIHRARSKGNERIYDVLGGIRSIYTTAQDTAGILTLISRIPDIGGIPRKWRRFPLPSRPGGTKKAKKKMLYAFLLKKERKKRKRLCNHRSNQETRNANLVEFLLRYFPWKLCSLLWEKSNIRMDHYLIRFKSSRMRYSSVFFHVTPTL